VRTVARISSRCEHFRRNFGDAERIAPQTRRWIEHGSTVGSMDARSACPDLQQVVPESNRGQNWGRLHAGTRNSGGLAAERSRRRRGSEDTRLRHAVQSPAGGSQFHFGRSMSRGPASSPGADVWVIRSPDRPTSFVTYADAAKRGGRLTPASRAWSDSDRHQLSFHHSFQSALPLPPLPTRNDNAAMDFEPPNAEPLRLKRRCLRTLPAAIFRY